jgi:hypothetical protein
VYLVLLASSAEAFHQLSAARAWLEDTIAARGLLPRLRALRPAEPTGASSSPGAAAAGGSRATGGGAGARGGAAGPPAPALNVLSVESLPRPLGALLCGAAWLWRLPAAAASRHGWADFS